MHAVSRTADVDLGPIARQGKAQQRPDALEDRVERPRAVDAHEQTVDDAVPDAYVDAVGVQWIDAGNISRARLDLVRSGKRDCDGRVARATVDRGQDDGDAVDSSVGVAWRVAPPT